MSRDEPQIERRDSCKQLKAEIGRRSAVSDNWRWCFLIIIGREPLRVRVHEMIEEVPVPLAVAEHRRALRRREFQLGAGGGSAETADDEWRGRPADREREHEEEVRLDCAPGRQGQSRYDGERHFTPHRRGPLSRETLDLRGCLPLEHSTVRDERAHEGAHNPVYRKESLVRKEDDGERGLLN